jgi:hypothetical protein
MNPSLACQLKRSSYRIHGMSGLQWVWKYISNFIVDICRAKAALRRQCPLQTGILASRHISF